MSEVPGGAGVSGAGVELFALRVTLRDLVRDLAGFCVPQLAAHPEEACSLVQSLRAMVTRLDALEAEPELTPQAWAFHRGRLVRIRERMETDLEDFLAVCTGDEPDSGALSRAPREKPAGIPVPE